MCGCCNRPRAPAPGKMLCQVSAEPASPVRQEGTREWAQRNALSERDQAPEQVPSSFGCQVRCSALHRANSANSTLFSKRACAAGRHSQVASAHQPFRAVALPLAVAVLLHAVRPLVYFLWHGLFRTVPEIGGASLGRLVHDIRDQIMELTVVGGAAAHSAEAGGCSGDGGGMAGAAKREGWPGGVGTRWGVDSWRG